MNINWGEVITRLIGDGVIITGIGFLIKYFIHRQSIELEKQKRIDYFLYRNYDELFEIAVKLHQLLLSWFQAALHAERGEIDETIANLWDKEFPVRYKEKIENICFGAFLKQNHLLLPAEIMDLCSKANKEYKNKQYEEVQKTVIDAELELNTYLEIKKSRAEIKRLFELSKD